MNRGLSPNQLYALVRPVAPVAPVRFAPLIAATGRWVTGAHGPSTHLKFPPPYDLGTRRG